MISQARVQAIYYIQYRKAFVLEWLGWEKLPQIGSKISCFRQTGDDLWNDYWTEIFFIVKQISGTDKPSKREKSVILKSENSGTRILKTFTSETVHEADRIIVVQEIGIFPSLFKTGEKDYFSFTNVDPDFENLSGW